MKIPKITQLPFFQLASLRFLKGASIPSAVSGTRLDVENTSPITPPDQIVGHYRTAIDTITQHEFLGVVPVDYVK